MSGLKPEILTRRTGYWLLLALALGIITRAGLMHYFALSAGLHPDAIVRGHDGGEYIDFAHALATSGLDAVPENARRHDPGWPIAISPVVASPTHGGLWAWAMGCAALAGSVVIGVRLLRTSGLAEPRQALRWAWAAVLIYPAQVYYGCFALSESLFTMLLVASIAAYSEAHRQINGRTKCEWMLFAAYVIAGLAGLVRSPGMLLGIAFATDSLLFDRDRAAANLKSRILRASPILLTILPWLVWTAIAHRAWGGDLLIHRPQFSWPFSGFAGWHEVSRVRAVYVFACVLIILVSTVALLAQWRRQVKALAPASTPAIHSPADLLIRISAVFCAMFVLFHLCLRSLHYIDRDVLTFNYQDRYYVGILPFLLLPWLNWLRWWAVLPGAIVSVVLSVYWGVNYFTAATLP